MHYCEKMMNEMRPANNLKRLETQTGNLPLLSGKNHPLSGWFLFLLIRIMTRYYFK